MDNQITWNKGSIQNLLETSQKAVERAVLTIYARQTADEQSSERTLEHNHRGFTGVDAEFCSSLAKGIIRYGGLTPKQLPHARRKIKKYWRQLLEEVSAKGGIVETKKTRKTALANTPISEIAASPESEIAVNTVTVDRPSQFAMF